MTEINKILQRLTSDIKELANDIELCDRCFLTDEVKHLLICITSDIEKLNEKFNVNKSKGDKNNEAKTTC